MTEAAAHPEELIHEVHQDLQDPVQGTEAADVHVDVPEVVYLEMSSSWQRIEISKSKSISP